MQHIGNEMDLNYLCHGYVEISLDITNMRLSFLIWYIQNDNDSVGIMALVPHTLYEINGLSQHTFYCIVGDWQTTVNQLKRNLRAI